MYIVALKLLAFIIYNLQNLRASKSIFNAPGRQKVLVSEEVYLLSIYFGYYILDLSKIYANLISNPDQGKSFASNIFLNTNMISK